MIFQEQKKLRKSQIASALQNELYNLQSLKLGTSNTSEGKVVKRFAQEYNRRMAEFVGVRTYTGSFTFQSLENHIMEQQGLLNRKTSIITRTQSEGYITPTFERYNTILLFSRRTLTCVISASNKNTIYRNRKPVSSRRESSSSKQKGISLPKLNFRDKR